MKHETYSYVEFYMRLDINTKIVSITYIKYFLLKIKVQIADWYFKFLIYLIFFPFFFYITL